MSEASKGYKPGQLNEIPSDFKKYRSPYDFDPEEIDVLQRRNLTPVWSQAFSLVTAQTPQQPLVINQPGRALRIVGLTNATKYDPVANTGIETVVSTVFVGIFLFNQSGNNQGQSDPGDAVYIKHGGGYRGDFISCGIFWPAQSSNAFRITIYRYDGVPWQSGDAST